MSAKRTAAVTIVARNYFAAAKVLFASLRCADPGVDCYLAVVDDAEEVLEPIEGVRRLRVADAVGHERFLRMAYSYDVTELCTAVKPFVMRAVLRSGCDRCFYFDPDVLVLRSIAGLSAELDSANMLLTPHLTSPLPLDGLVPSEQTMLQCGAYNLGFIAVRESLETERFIDWWSDRLESQCVRDPAAGLFVDQRWIDLIPGMFDGVRVLRDRALNVAYWNLHERPLDEHDRTRLASGEEIVFTHFSGFDPHDPLALSKYQNRIAIEPGSALHRTLAEYGGRLFANGYARYLRLPYGFDVTVDGFRMDQYARYASRAGIVRSGGAPSGSDFDRDAGNEPGLPFRYTAYVGAMYESRPDLRDAFPDALGTGAPAFAQWLRTHGTREGDERLVRAALGEPHVPFGVATAPIQVVGYVRSQSGLGSVTRSMLGALRLLDVPVSVVDVSALAPSRELEPECGDPVASECETPALTIVCVNPLDHDERTLAGTAKTGVLVGSWWWELPELPASIWDRAADFAEIWVGSRFVLDAVAKSATVPVTRIPPAIAPAVSGAATRRSASEPLSFLYMFDYLSIFERKNPLAALDAFTRAFETRRDVRLVVKTVNAERDPAHHRALVDTASHDPRIRVFDAHLSAAETSRLVASCDAYVSLHRCEGFGLTIAEAMSYGKPAIATGWSGNMDYMTHENSFPVSYAMVPIVDRHGPYPIGQFWADPDVEAAAFAMRRVAGDYDAALAVGERGRETIRHAYSAVAVAATISERLERISRVYGVTPAR